MVSLAKLLRIMQGIGRKYKNMGLEKFLLSNVDENFPGSLVKFDSLLLQIACDA
jgi:hypothetical protein